MRGTDLPIYTNFLTEAINKANANLSEPEKKWNDPKIGVGGTRFAEKLMDVSQSIFEEFLDFREKHPTLARENFSCGNFADKAWTDCLEGAYDFISLCEPAVFNLRPYVGNKTVKTKHFSLLMILHENCCNILREILCLIRHRYGNASWSRWRTLHEAATVISALAEIGDKATDPYLAHGLIELLKYKQMVNEYYEFNNSESFDQEKIGALKKKESRAIKKYGNNIKNSYGWAAIATGESISNFKQLEARFGLKQFRPQYKKASQLIHSGPESLILDIDIDGDKNYRSLTAGSIDEPFDVPLDWSLISLNFATASILLKTSKHEMSDVVVFTKIIDLFCDHIRNMIAELMKTTK